MQVPGEECRSRGRVQEDEKRKGKKKKKKRQESQGSKGQNTTVRGSRKRGITMRKRKQLSK